MRAGARARVCDNSLFPIRRLHLNNLFCRNLTLSMHHAYQAHSVAGEGGGNASPVESQETITAERTVGKAGKMAPKLSSHASL